MLRLSADWNRETPVIDLPFKLPERTETRDRWYSILGRALVVATEFESNCRGLAIYFGVRSEPNLLGDTGQFNAFVEKASRVSLHTTIENIEYGIGDTRGILTQGRMARNTIAHESNFLFNGQLSEEFLEREFESWIGGQCEAIVIANYTVLMLMGVLGLLEAGLPKWDSVAAYPKELTEWILLDET